MINLVVSAVKAIASDQEFLARRGLTAQEFELALPAAIQRIRGSAAAGVSDRKTFLSGLFQRLVDDHVISGFEKPEYGDDTVYKLHVPNLGIIAVIQKGCPDGNHSSVSWSAPDWAQETYLWWLCDSLQYEPGEHVAKGVNRLRNRFFDKKYADAVDGVIFHNMTCGTSLRPCPKIDYGIEVDGKRIPPPCIWAMPERQDIEGDTQMDWNWSGSRRLGFPTMLLNAFGIENADAALYTGHIGFLKGQRGTRTTIASRYGPGRSTVFRSDPR